MIVWKKNVGAILKGYGEVVNRKVLPKQPLLPSLHALLELNAGQKEGVGMLPGQMQIRPIMAGVSLL